MPRSPSRPTIAAIALLAGLAACNNSKSADTAALDKDLANGVAAADIDPALAGALGNQIVVDPARTRAKPDGERTATGTIGDLARAQASAPGGRKCDFPYDLAWAGKLPAELPLYPGAKVAEAAGSDAAGCKRRIVSFAAAAAPAKVIDFYRAKLTAAGYSAEHLVEQGNDVLGGTRGNSAYYISVAPAKGGSTVDLVSNGG